MKIRHPLNWFFLNCLCGNLFCRNDVIFTSEFHYIKHREVLHYILISYLFACSQLLQLNVLPIQLFYAKWISKYQQISTLPSSIVRWKSKSHEHLLFSYGRQKSTGTMSNHSEHNGDVADLNGEILQAIPMINDVEDSSTTSKEPLNYTTYLRLPGVLDSVHCLSHVNPLDETSPPIHDEHFFIIIHQSKSVPDSRKSTKVFFVLVFELWFKAFLYEIDSIRQIFNNSSQVVPLLFYINLRLTRSVGIWNMLIEMLQGLETMTPVEFLAFRDYVTPASGFQSLQFRIIEMRLGLTDNFRQSYKTKYFTETMFKGEQSRELKKIVEEESLLTLLEVSLIIQLLSHVDILTL